MCKLKKTIGFSLILALQFDFIFADLSIDQLIRAGNKNQGKTVRLVDGTSKFEGRVEVFHDNTWGTVCDDYFGDTDAQVLCHMLGYQREGATAYRKGKFRHGKGKIWLDDLRCFGKETSVDDCYHRGWGSHNCVHFEDAGIKCQERNITNKENGADKMVTLQLDLLVEGDQKKIVFERYKNYSKIFDSDPSKRWKRTIPYVFAPGVDIQTKELIQDALDEWELYSCLDFSKDTSDVHYNKIVFTSSNDKNKGCASAYVGMKQGPQEIHIGKACLYKEIILHEIGHALGLFHEHNRADRDKYIKVHYENIKDGYEGHFEKWRRDEFEDLINPFDYKSIMHYGKFYFSRNESQELVTIETLRPEFQEIIGKAKHPSFLDYRSVANLYECSESCDDLHCPEGGFVGKHCQCFCEGRGSERTVTPCYESSCPKPKMDPFLFLVFDKFNETFIYLSRDIYPDGTIFNVSSTNVNCCLSTEYRCDNGEWKGNMPNCPIELELEFAEGSGNEGILVVILNGQRGIICDDNWDNNDASVACRMMGYQSGKVLQLENTLRKGNRTLPFLMDDIKCSGEEATLSECQHNGWGNHNCKRNEAAAAKCFERKFTVQSDAISSIIGDDACSRIPLQSATHRESFVSDSDGPDAFKGRIPWQARIERLKGTWIHWCGGTILNSHWVLSAAHCFDDFTSNDHGHMKMSQRDIRVFVGDNDIMNADEYEQRFEIQHVVKHWQYNESYTEHPEYDVALLKVKSESGDGIVFDNYVQPACLPERTTQFEHGAKCVISGWGMHVENGSFTDKLNAAEVSIIEDKECKRSYQLETLHMFCAGDACHGDSGGPLVCNIDGRGTVMGITSRGDACSSDSAPVVYTRVTAIVDWVKYQIHSHYSADCSCERNQVCLLVEKTCIQGQQCTTKTCQNGGTCVKTSSTQKCYCPTGFQGVDCSQNDAEPTYYLRFKTTPVSRILKKATFHVEECLIDVPQGLEVQYEWTLNGAPIEAYNERSGFGTHPGGLLQIDKFTDKHVGEYSCTAVTALASTVKHVFKYRIAEDCDVRIYPGPQSETKKIDENALLTCHVDSRANAVRWKKDGVYIDYDESPRFKKLVNNYLQIRDIGLSDAGIYRCEAEDNNGCYSYKEGTLTVIDVKPLNKYCGISIHDEAVLASTRITKGKAARPNANPWHVTINTKDNRTLFGGTVISQSYILTAAHFIRQFEERVGLLWAPENVYILFGTTNCFRKGGETTRTFKSFRVHPDYGNETDFDSDIALIELDSPVQYTDAIRPICLEPAEYNDRVFLEKSDSLYPIPGKVAGCGKTRYRGRFARQLQEVYLPYVRRNECEASLERTSIKITDRMFCAGSNIARTGDSCGGDIGGGLVMSASTRWVQTGIVSWGVGGCDRDRFYGVYTDVGKFYDWIEGITKFSEEEAPDFLGHF